MRLNNFFVVVSLVLLLAGCGGGGGGGGGGTPTPATLVSIAIAPANPKIALGTAQQFTATGSYSDHSTRDLTGSVTWSSSVPGIATVDNDGLASSVSIGTTAIAASLAVSQPLPGSISGSATLTVAAVGSVQANVIPISVNGSLCSSGSFPNKACVSVTICTPGTSTCQTVSDILLDTGSYGLRIFSQALTVPLTPVTVPTGTLTECIQFGDGSSEWGPVRTADVVLGGEPAVSVPIQVVDTTFGTRPRSCRNADISPSSAGFNGILGIGPLLQDCGSDCVSAAKNLNYYACTGASCSGTPAPLTLQVQNPVPLLPQDNNGLLVQLPAVPLGGSTSVDGQLILGIGTRPNNAPGAAVMYAANDLAEFTTTFNGQTMNGSFIDSGSNVLFFPASTSLLPACRYPDSNYYCPATTKFLSAVNTGTNGSPSGTAAFEIGNYENLIAGPNNVFSELGSYGAGSFDWGLPFFFGRNVFIGIEGASSSLGTGPYWAY